MFKNTVPLISFAESHLAVYIDSAKDELYVILTRKNKESCKRPSGIHAAIPHMNNDDKCGVIITRASDRPLYQ